MTLLSVLYPLVACGGSDGPHKETPEPVVEPAIKARGADVSWVTQLEKEGAKFYTPDSPKKEIELMQLLRDYCCVNAVRLRVWVNPERSAEYSAEDDVNGWCDIDDTMRKALRAKELGLELMINFHFSDTWADPGRQYIPNAWKNFSYSEMKKAVSDHVSQTLLALQKVGVEPQWVQLGNEVTNGMMQPMGDISKNPAQFVGLFMAGSEAAKAVFPRIKTIVHLDNGDNIWAYERMGKAFVSNGGTFDMIGMSLYPQMRVDNGDYSTCEAVVESCIANAKTLKEEYGKPVMMCEFGMPYTAPKLCGELIRKLMYSPLEGLFYWEPEGKGYMENRQFIDGVPSLEAFSGFAK